MAMSQAGVAIVRVLRAARHSSEMIAE
jgi:hypothetical protein